MVTLIGVILAFIFTIFPFPITSRDILRQDVAYELHLLSNVYSLSQTRMNLAVLSDGTKESQVLRKQMGKQGFKCIAVQTRCKENLAYSSWEPNMLYRFPKKTYADLLSSMERYLPLRTFLH
jgi:hypothetical protein